MIHATVDVIFAHRADPDVPMLEVVRAFNWVIEQGKAFYWATSEWSLEQIEEAHREFSLACVWFDAEGFGCSAEIAEKYGLHAPVSRPLFARKTLQADSCIDRRSMQVQRPLPEARR